ncbi:MAG: hypothetical protein OQK11_04925 [Thiovulaceae bacterium]|nr:hypothetical protein [Sulfurimonadaceae bacterium]
MKYIVVFIMIISTFINADEINRIESIVDDITKLRIELKECNNDKLKVQKFEKQLNKYKKLLISKEKEIEKLRKRKKNYKI